MKSNLRNRRELDLFSESIEFAPMVFAGGAVLPRGRFSNARAAFVLLFSLIGLGWLPGTAYADAASECARWSRVKAMQGRVTFQGKGTFTEGERTWTTDHVFKATVTLDNSLVSCPNSQLFLGGHFLYFRLSRLQKPTPMSRREQTIPGRQSIAILKLLRVVLKHRIRKAAAHYFSWTLLQEFIGLHWILLYGGK